MATSAFAAVGPLQSQIKYYTENNGTNFLRSLSPFTGTESQTANSDGSVTMSITGASGYADSGFVIYDGKLGDLNNFNLTGSGNYGLNLWFDVDNSGEYFVWSSDTYTGVGGDNYALGPSSSGGAMNVSDSSNFYLTSNGTTYTLAQLKAGVAGITSNTNIAIWVGVTLSAGGDTSATVSIPTPSIPTITTPANGATVTSAAMVKVDWTDSTGGTLPILYQYQAFSDAAYTSLIYDSGMTLSASEIPTPGTPDGVYFVRVKAMDAGSNTSDWSNGASAPYEITVDSVAPVLTFPGYSNQSVGGYVYSSSINACGSTTNSEWIAWEWNLVNSGGSPVLYTYKILSAPLSIPEAVGYTVVTSDTHYYGDFAGNYGIFQVQVVASDTAGNTSSPVICSVDYEQVAPTPVGPPTDMNQCKKDGWKTFNNPTFKNQGSCVSYVQANAQAGKQI